MPLMGLFQETGGEQVGQMLVMGRIRPGLKSDRPLHFAVADPM